MFKPNSNNLAYSSVKLLKVMHGNYVTCVVDIKAL